MMTATTRKRLWLTLSALLLTALSAIAQAPQSFTYQAVVRDASGRLVADEYVGVRLTLLQGSEDGTAVYTDQQRVRTDHKGLFSLLIGHAQQPLRGIDWAHGPYFLRSEVDLRGGTDYTISTTQQLLSVPYALHARTADSLASGTIAEHDPLFAAWNKDYYSLINRPTIPTVPTNVSAFTNDAGYLTSFTETQVLSISHDTIYLTGGSFVKLPAAAVGFSGDYNDLTNKPTLATVATSGDYNDLTNKPTIPTNVSAFTNDAGYLTSFSEAQVLSIGHDTIYLTGGSFVKLPAGFSGNYADLTGKPTLATVATSGDYNDLTNKPTIPTVPTNVSALTNDAGYLTSYSETQTLAQVVALGNTAGAQVKGVSNPTEALDAVNLQTLNSAVSDAVSAAVASLTHRYDSITTAQAHRYDSITARQQHVIDSLNAQLASINSPFTADGATRSTFSISAGKAVKFSRGNLQYNAAQGTHAVSGGGTAQGTWRFAEHQYDYIGSANSNISSSYNGWIDLFGWGTSGWNSGAVAWQPWSTSISSPDYYPGGSYTNSLTGAYANADWGVYNAISNGGNQPGQWRTLTKDELAYLFDTRTASTVNGTANARYAKAAVNGVSGMILFPDSYTHPDGIAQPTNINNGNANYTGNTYTTTDWAAMEAAGCVFLPAAGSRAGTSVNYFGAIGCYWTSSSSNSYFAYELGFHSGSYCASSSNAMRYAGYAVRPVQD